MLDSGGRQAFVDDDVLVEDGVDDDDELLQDAAFLSIKTRNYWRADEDDDEDWLEMFEEALGGEEGGRNLSHDDLDQYEGEREMERFYEEENRFYEEGDFHPNRLIDGASSPPTDGALTPLTPRSSAPRSSLPRSPASRPPTPMDWMSTISRRHLQFYNLVANETSSLSSSSSSSSAGEPGATREIPLPVKENNNNNSICAKNWTPTVELAPYPEKNNARASSLSSAVAMTPVAMGPCLAHRTPTVKRSDSKLKRPTMEEKVVEAAAGNVGGLANGGVKGKVLEKARGGELVVGGKRGNGGKKESSPPVNDEESHPNDALMCIDRSFSDGSAATTMTKLFLRRDAELRRCVSSCPSINAASSAGNLSCTASSVCVCRSTTHASMSSLCRSTRACGSTRACVCTPTMRASAPMMRKRGRRVSHKHPHRNMLVFHKLALSQLKKRYPDLSVFIERTIPKLIDLAVIFVNNWMNEKHNFS